MSLGNGRQYLAIPGPSTIPDRVLAAMHRPAPNIYAGDLIDMVAGLWPDLRAVARTSQHVALYIGNGHAAWEAANVNMFARGDRALVLVTGSFGVGWANSVRPLGVEVETIDFGGAAPADPGRLEAALRADTGHLIRAVLVTHVDTGTSVLNDIASLRAAIDAAGHPALLAVDAIASLACDPFEFDAWGVDVLVAACQKGLMTPPGLGFVWFSDRAREAANRSDLRTPYWNWEPRVFGGEFFQHFGGTAPTHHLFGLREALDMIAEEGLEAVWARHHRLARAVWAAVDAWGEGGPMALNVPDAGARGWSVTGVNIGAPHAEALRAWVETRAGVILGLGLRPGGRATDRFRIAHMGHVNAHMTLGMLGSIEAALTALGIPHGTGALEAAAAVVAEA